MGTPHEVATEVSLNTAFGVERVVRDAFARAQRRPRRKLTLVHKTNVLVNAGAVWSRLVGEVGLEFPDVTVDYLHIDAATIFMTDRTTPSMFEPVHGSAPDIAGRQKADPTAAILSASLLLDHLGYADAAAVVERAVVADLADRVPGTPRRPSEVGDAIAGRVAG